MGGNHRRQMITLCSMHFKEGLPLCLALKKLKKKGNYKTHLRDTNDSDDDLWKESILKTNFPLMFMEALYCKGIFVGYR